MAIHTRFDRNKQGSAADRYYFAHNEQLFDIMISHSENWEDWDSHNRYVESFTLER